MEDDAVLDEQVVLVGIDTPRSVPFWLRDTIQNAIICP